MRDMFFAAAASIAAFASPAAASGVAIPAEFHGLWEATQYGVPPACRESLNDGLLRVTPDRMDFHESICVPQGIIPSDDGIFRMQVYCEGEGTEWVKSEALRTQEHAGHRYMAIDGIIPGSHYQYIYGLCPAGAGIATDVQPQEPSRSYCYRQDMSEFSLTIHGDATADFEIQSAQGGAHICSLSGRATSLMNGYRYSERLESGAQCQLSMVFDDQGGISFEDPDWACKQHYCGARAAFEHIEFGPNSRVDCE